MALHRVGEHSGLPFLVLERVYGESLQAILDHATADTLPDDGAALGRSSRTWCRAVAEVMVEVLKALEYAHGQGVVHRDLKPSNVLMERDGRIRVVDFGLARMADRMTMTASEELVGTLGYLTPECLRDHRNVGTWTDVYAAGVMLYQLATLRPPFGGGTPSTVLERIRHGIVRPPHQVQQGVPLQLSAVIGQAMAFEQGRRYPGARWFREDLQRFLASEPVEARPSGALTRLWRQARRRPDLAALLVLLSVGIPGLTAVAFWVTPIVRAAASRERSQQLEDSLTTGFMALAEVVRDEPSRAVRERGTVPGIAAKAFAAARALVPEDRDALDGSALLELLCGHPEATIRLLPAANTSRAVALLRASALEKLGQADAATAAFETAAPASRTFDWVVELMLPRKQGDMPAERLTEARRAIRHTILTARYPRLLDYMVLCRGPDNASGSDRMDEWAEAMVDNFPNSFAARYTAGITLRRLGNADRALYHLRIAASLASGSAIVANAIGNVMVDLEKWDEARASLDEALRLDSRYAEAFYNLGNTLRMQGKLDAAVIPYLRAIELAPELGEAYLGLTCVLMDTGENEKAYLYSSELVHLQPRSPKGLWNHAIVCFMTHRPKEAETAAGERLLLAPDDDVCRYLLAQVLQRQRKSAEAIQLFEQVAAGSSNYSVPAKGILAQAREMVGVEALLTKAPSTAAAPEAYLAAAKTAEANRFLALASDLFEPIRAWLVDKRRWNDLAMAAEWAAGVAAGHGDDSPRQEEVRAAYARQATERLRAAFGALLAERDAGNVSAQETRDRLAAWECAEPFAVLRRSEDEATKQFWQQIVAEHSR